MIGYLIFVSMIVSSQSGDPYLLQGFPTESTRKTHSFDAGACKTAKSDLTFDGPDEKSFNESKCHYNSDQSLLKCKLGMVVDPSVFDQYRSNTVKILIIFVQEFPLYAVLNRVINVCFIDSFSSSLEEIAICGYRPAIISSYNYTNLHILDVAALAAVAPDIHTLLLSGVNLWQSVELRQFTSLKHLLILQGETIRMQYYHTAYCADCEATHPLVGWSFHYLIELHSQLNYFLYDSDIPYTKCSFDLIKKVQASSSPIPRLLIASSFFHDDEKNEICNKCDSGLCPLLAICLDQDTKDRRKKDAPFECLCIEEVNVDDELISCDPMTLHLPMYSTRCNKSPSIFKYLTLPIYLVLSYLFASLIVFIVSTIVLIKLR